MLHPKTANESCWKVDVEGQQYVYTEYQDQKNSKDSVKQTLQNQYGRDITDPPLLEMIRKAVIDAS